MALRMVNRRLLTGGRRCVTIVSACTKSLAGNECTKPICRCLLTGTVLVAQCKPRKRLDFQNPDPAKLSVEYQLKTTSAHAADSVTTILSQTAGALIDAEENYREVVKVVIQLTEHYLGVLGTMDEDRLWDVILEAQKHAEKFNLRRKELDMLFSSVRKLVDSTSEVAFLTGADFTSSSLGEHLHSAQRHVDSAKSESQQMEERLQEVQAKSVKTLAEHSQAERRIRRHVQEKVSDKTEARDEAVAAVLDEKP